MILQPLVEGHGDELAIPVLLRRLRDECGAFSVEVGWPIRRRRSELTDQAALRHAIRLALRQERGCDGILIVFDGDEDCPKTLAPEVQRWARAEARTVPCEVVIAHREYEAWFLGVLESLRGQRGIREDAEPPAEPESIRGAKEKLRTFMGSGALQYVEVKHQPALTARFDLAAAYRSCRSFRRMVRAFGLLASAAGAEIGDWPPPSWLQRA